MGVHYRVLFPVIPSTMCHECMVLASCGLLHVPQHSISIAIPNISLLFHTYSLPYPSCVVCRIIPLSPHLLRPYFPQTPFPTHAHPLPPPSYTSPRSTTSIVCITSSGCLCCSLSHSLSIYLSLFLSLSLPCFPFASSFIHLLGVSACTSAWDWDWDRAIPYIIIIIIYNALYVQRYLYLSTRYTLVPRLRTIFYVYIGTDGEWLSSALCAQPHIRICPFYTYSVECFIWYSHSANGSPSNVVRCTLYALALPWPRHHYAMQPISTIQQWLYIQIGRATSYCIVCTIHLRAHSFDTRWGPYSVFPFQLSIKHCNSQYTPMYLTFLENWWRDRPIKSFNLYTMHLNWRQL